MALHESHVITPTTGEGAQTETMTQRVSSPGHKSRTADATHLDEAFRLVEAVGGRIRRDNVQIHRSDGGFLPRKPHASLKQRPPDPLLRTSAQGCSCGTAGCTETLASAENVDATNLVHP